jgi:hypothetical protein
MYTPDDLVATIVNSSQVPSGRRRQEIARELRAHIEDFVLIAREAGHTEEEIGRLVAENFGDPREIADEFAAVYRLERAVLRASVFLLATLMATSFISTVVLGLQASMALGLGVPVTRVFAGHHLRLETFYIFCTVVAYVGLLSLEKVFARARFGKGVVSLALLFTFAGFGLSPFNVPVQILCSAFASGVLLRTMQLFINSKFARIGAATSLFGLFGLLAAFRQSPGVNEAALQLFVWLAIGVCGYLMTSLSGHVDRALSNGFQQT